VLLPATFNLPVNDPIFIHAGQDNGTEPGDDGESDLDVEISGGIAPNAQVYFVVGTPTFLVDGITNSIQYIVENNLADIMSISYGSCESVEGAGGNAYDNQAFEQAAAQGISVFVASGGCGTPVTSGATFHIGPMVVVPVAVVPPPGAAPKTTAGAEVQPKPRMVKVTPVTDPPLMVVLPVGVLVPPPPLNVADGAVT